MKTLIPILIIITLSGCATRKACMKKFPMPPATTVTETKIIERVRDTTIFVKIPADTVFQVDSVLIGSDGLINYPVQRLDVDFAFSLVSIENSKLKHILQQKDKVIAETIAAAIKESATIEKEIIREPHPVAYPLTWWQQLKMKLGILFIFTMLGGALFFILRAYFGRF